MKINDPFNSLFAGVSYWDDISVGYDKVAKWIMKSFAIKAMELAEIHENSSVIDVACGTGILSLLLSSKTKQVKAIDFSPKMIGLLNETVLSRKISNIQASVSNGQKLNFKDSEFDAAFSMFGLMFFPDRLKGFSELLRVLKPGKKAVISSWAPITKSSLMSLLLETLNYSCADAVPEKNKPLPLENPEDFQNEMETVGFKKVEIIEVRCNFSPLAPSVFWKTLTDGGPISMIKKEMGMDKWDQVSERALYFLRDKTGINGLETYSTAYLGVGHK